MGFKQYGPNVSENPQSIVTGGQYSAEDKSFETLVIETAKPIIDWEINLQEEISNDQGSRLQAQRIIPSCFIEGDFLERSDISGSYIKSGTPTNSFNIKGSNFTVNGWPLKFEFSDTSTVGTNTINLPAPPAGAGTTRTDLVIIEVWRALITAAPSVANKSPTGLILRFGNVKAPDAVNLVDDLIDPTYTLQSSKRVQIQYRYRVISGVDVTAYPDGLDDPSVTANTVSDFTGPGADGSPTAFGYSKSSIDPGLWIAGSGTAITAAALGTVDGFMYAIPLCAVFRRNSAAFNKATNLNGSNAVFPAPSDRPDGYYSNQINLSDIKDLRKSIAWDLSEVLQKSYQQLLDNSLQTEHQITASGSGTSYFSSDVLGTSVKAGNPDGVRLHFSDRSTIESIVVKSVIGGAPTSSVTFLLNALPIVQGSGVHVTNVSAASPICIFGGVLQIRSVTAVSDTATVVSSVVINAASIVINFPAPITNTNIYAQIQIIYPPGLGLTKTPVDSYQFWSPDPTLAPWNTWVDPATFSATSDANRFFLDSSLWSLDPLHRELFVRYQSINQTVTIPSSGATNVKIPEKIVITAPGVTINDGANPVYTTTSVTENTSYSDVTLSFARPIGTPITVTYKAYRPLPPVGAPPFNSHQIFYKARSTQSLAVPAGNVDLPLTPRVISESLNVMTSGSGSPDNSYPFVSPGVQIPTSPIGPLPEFYLDSPSVISLPSFNIDSGMVQIPSLLPYVPSPSEVDLVSGAGDTTQDGDGRNFWPKTNGAFYLPSAFSYPFNLPQKHKISLATLMELSQDFASIGRKGTLVLVVFTRLVETLTENSVKVLSVPDDSCAAIYRVRGNMINPRRGQ